MRMSFFEGQLLSADDLRTEQDYHRQMRYLHNRLLHGWGIVDGYGVEDDGGTVLVGPGVAIDSLGHELVLPESARIELPPEAAVAEQTLWYLVATWEEISGAPVVVGEEVTFSRWIERCAISISPIAPDDDGRALLLAALTVATGNIASIDTAGRRPLLGASTVLHQTGS
ncbi:MAG: hypothetical protein QOE71_2532 [Pseudonocardiales bacterium]|nr:hypothetical protein [Pseudonocardiales bacterium]MDQ1751476.1 hypothetical protein [Pseudonocardiales bacterium]